MSGSATDDGERLDFDRLLDDFTSAVRRGESTDIDDWAARYPEHAESIRELFPTVLTLERARSDGTRPAQPFGIGVVERLGDYRILREIGRGGMGVVYEAEQESLGRRVAVKVLPPMRDDKRVRRFEREARTAAGLHHTNIVPIFGVGEQDGWHYYVMQVIAGVGLDVVLRRLREERGSPGGTTPRDVVHALLDLPAEGGPRGGGQTAYWRSIAEIGRQAAEALAYAHSKGVLHRDVKPGNLLLDRQGVVWVTDFGLAKAVGHAGITLSGDLVGTLQYMAPEQLHGRADARTDLYGLGLTLYELLTLRPAFSDADRGGLIQKIEHGRATPLRAIVPELPRDLETIVLGAIEPDPRHRYADARALAEDLQRFLDDRPIRARRTTAIEQVWRWGRRNRAIAALAAIALFATVAAAVSGWGSYVETRRLLVESTAETDRANRTLEAALAFIQDVFDRTSRADRIEIYVDDSGDEADFEWYSPANVSADDVALLERALDFYSVFAEINAGVEDLTPRIAKACTQMGDLLWQMRRIDEAAAAYQRARELYTRLDGGRGEHRITLASLRNDTGRVMMEAADPDEAIAAFTAALELLGDDRSKVGRFERARSHLLLGIASFDRRWRSEGRGQGERRGRGRAGYFDVYRHFLTAYELNRALVAEDPANPTFRLAAARSGRHLALATPPPRAVAGGSVAPGSIANLPIVEETLDELRALADADDAPAAYRAELAWTCVEFATRLPRRGRFGGRDDAPASDPVVQAWIAEALALAEGLYRERPDAADHVRLLADALAEAARLDADTDLAIAEQRIRRALDLRAVATPSAREMSRGIEDRLALADILLRAGRGDEAVDRALEAVATAEARLASEPAVRAFAAELLAALWSSATIARDAGDHATAVDCLRRLQAAHPPNLSPSLDLRIALATALLSSGDVDAAVDETEALLSAAGERSARIGFGPRNRLRDRAATELCAGLRDRGHGELADALEGRLRREGRR